MIIKSLSCRNFRNIEKTEIYPDGKMNVICGDNAQGKTNIIEAIWLFTGAKSFRTNKDSELLKFGEEKGEIEINYISGGIENTAKIEITDKKTAFFNGKKIGGAASLAGKFKAFIFSPDDLSIVKAGPSVRRKFLNTAIGQLYPSYISLLKDYNRAVLQRNHIIKDFKYDGSLSVMLDVFEKELEEKGEKIIHTRKRFIKVIEEFLPEIYKGISSGKEKLEIKYNCSFEGEKLSELLKKRRSENMYTGTTDVGPHRDDLEFFINGSDVRSFGSQGQMRSVALALKLAEGEVINKISGEYPVCLLDDVMSELDPARQNYILNHISERQSFLTCCDSLNTEKLKKGKIFTVKKGDVI